MTDDPFAPSGNDRTIIVPAPGRRAPTSQIVPSDRDRAEGQAPSSGLNSLVAIANPLLNLIPQLRASATHPDPASLNAELSRGIRDFEARARAAGIPSEKVIAARYVLCTVIDEMAAGTPWGAAGQWASKGLLATFHNEVSGGEKFFQLLGRVAERAQANLDLLELMFVCLELGFEGRYRVIDNGRSQLEAVRRRLLSLVRQHRGPYERELSPSWRGLAAAARPTGVKIPLWVIGAVTAVLLLGIYVGFRWPLTSATDQLAREIARLSVPAAKPVAPAPKPAPPRLATFLAEDIAAGRVRVEDLDDRSIVTIRGDGLFRPGETRILPAFEPLLARIADALDRVPGRVEVIGHTDSQPIRTLRYPSNFELSLARADSVRQLLASRVPAARISAEGRGDADAVDTSSTPEGRARNRRVEIVLRVPAKAPAPDAKP
jgi:type VI secretion system protein ImpK